MSMVKKILIGFCALIIVMLAVSYFFLGSIVKTGIEKIGPKVTGTAVSVGAVTISPLTGSGRIHDLAIGNPPGFKSESAVKMKDFRINLVPKSLIKDVVVIRSVHIDGPEITKEGGNLETIQRNVQNFMPEDKGAKKSSKKVIIDDLRITNAKVRVEILGKLKVITIPDIRLTGLGRESGGTSPAKVVEKVLNSLLSGVTSGIKNVGKSMKDEAGKVGSGLKDLIKKK